MPYVKIGSGDITWRASLSAVTNTGLPIILATGASTLQEIDRAVSMIREKNQPYVLMQCNTNYTGDESNFKYLNLNVLKDFAHRYPDAVLGLSDHSDGDVSVLGAVALGARVIEKHFTDDKNRLGPDHKFSMSPDEWRFMVERTRILEKTLGDGNKKVENNELEARVVQRRALRYAAKLPVGKVIEIDDLVSLRPAPADALDPFFDLQVVGKTLVREVDFHDLVSLNDFNP